MSVIRINIDAANSSCQGLRESIRKISDIETRLSSLRNSVDARIKARRGIDSKLNSTWNSLQDIGTGLRALDIFVTKSASSYLNVENYLKHQALGVGGAAGTSILDNKYANLNYDGLISAGEELKNYDPDSYEAIEDFEDNWLDKVTRMLADDLLGAFNDIAHDVIVPGIAIYKHLPKFKVVGDKLKLFNSDYYKGRMGLARWYSLKNINSGKYPEVSKLYKISSGLKIVKTAGKVLSWVSLASSAYEELAANENISIERKISNATVEVASALAIAKTGAMAGGAIGSAVGTIFPVVGNVVGGVIGAAFGVAISLGINYLVDRPIWNNGTKSTMDIIKDTAGDFAEKGVEFVGNCAKGVSEWVNKQFEFKFETGGVLYLP